MIKGRMYITKILLLLLVMPSMNTRFLSEAEGMDEEGSEQVGLLVRQVVETHLSDCDLVFMTSALHSSLFSAMYRQTAMGVVMTIPESSHHQITKALKREISRNMCRAVVLHVDDDEDQENSNITSHALRNLELGGLWKLPETRVFVVGRNSRVEDVLLQPCFRNTVHVYYVVIQSFPSEHLFHHSGRPAPTIKRISGNHRIAVYRRCLFCHKGNTGIEFEQQWNLVFTPRGWIYQNITRDSNTVQEALTDLQGHRFRLTTVLYFPFVDYTRDRPERGTTVTLRDSLNVRILKTFAKALNFTYEVHENVERSFGGLRDDGQFSGMMGELQREESDFCMLLAPSSERGEVSDYLRLEPVDSFAFISRKPSFLPANLSLIRPLSGELWLAVSVGLVIWSITAWVFHFAWRVVSEGRHISITKVFLYGWGALVEQPPSDPSSSVSGQMMVGIWLVFALVICTGFKSSLIAHLTVQGKTKTPDDFQDMVEFENWGWGTEPWLLDGQLLDYYTKNTNPVVQKIYKGMQVMNWKRLLAKALEGRFSVITAKQHITVIVASFYTDKYGQIPFYFGKKEFTTFACFGWGIRKGAPFLEVFTRVAARLEDTGIVPFWTNDVVALRVKTNRDAAKGKLQTFLDKQDNEDQVVLGLDHLQSGFYLLFLGSALSFFTLLAESIATHRFIPSRFSPTINSPST